MKSITIGIMAVMLCPSKAFALVVERQLSIVPAQSITTITSIYTSTDTRVISPTVAVWTDNTVTLSTTFPIKTPTPSVVTSLSTKTIYSSTSTSPTSSSPATPTSTSISTTSTAPTTIMLDATTATSSMASTSNAAIAAGIAKNGLGAGAFAGIGVVSTLVLVVAISFCFCIYKRHTRKLSEPKLSPPTPSSSKTPKTVYWGPPSFRKPRESFLEENERRQEALRQHIAPKTVSEKFKSWFNDQGSQISNPTITHINLNPVSPKHPYTGWYPQRPKRPTSETDSFIANLQHGPQGSAYMPSFGVGENEIEVEESNQREDNLPQPDPYLSVPPKPRRVAVASSIYSQQTSQPYWLKRGTINTTTINNAIDSTLEDYASRSVDSQPPHNTVMDERVNQPSSSNNAHVRDANDYSQYTDGEDPEEYRQRQRDMALRMLTGESNSNRDTGMSAEFGLRMRID